MTMATAGTGGGRSWADHDTVWKLVEIDGQAFGAEATLSIGAAAVIGRGPCNSFRASQTADYPKLDIRQMAVTRRACPEMALESAYLERLQRMTEGEMRGDRLVLSNAAGNRLVFQPSGN